MKRRLHSIPETLWFKWIFPFLWIAAFLFANVALLAMLIGLLPIPEGKKGSVLFLSNIFPVGTLLGAYFLIALANELKHVTLTENHVVIRGFFTTVHITLGDIVSVEESKILNLSTVVTEFEHETPFGKSVQFVPAGFLFYWGPAPSPFEDL